MTKSAELVSSMRTKMTNKCSEKIQIYSLYKQTDENYVNSVIIAGEKEEHCFNIDYFPQEEYSPDPNDSTLSIPCKQHLPFSPIR